MNFILRNFFFDIRTSKQSYNPNSLFSGVCKRNSRFRGFQQQDAHDLLINLVEMLVQEHDTMYKRTKEEKMNRLRQSYIEQVFGSNYVNSGNLVKS